MFSKVKKAIRNSVVILASVAAIYSCSDSNSDSNPVVPTPKALKIVVFSDPHFYDVSLGVAGEAFQNYVFQDRKMIAQSQDITTSLINSIIGESPDVVLVTGDLTKDGEQQCHTQFAAQLKKLTDKGIKVYVIPGNHDVNNPESYSYSGANTIKIPNVSAQKFAEIYNNFGYNTSASDIKYRDVNSLSYVAQPSSNVWILAVDDCRYDENTTSAVTSGKISAQTLNWIRARLSEAKQKNITVLGMMHHGMLEHFSGYALNPVSKDYIVNDYAAISKELADSGLKTIFTGHFHANDIVKYQGANNFLFDIETGSTVTAPCPYRVMTLTTDSKLEITSKHITSISSNTSGFEKFASDYLLNGMKELLTYQLINQYGATQAQAAVLAPMAANAFVAHYAGDEKLTDPTTIGTIAALKASADQTQKYFGSTIEAVYTDLAPADNNIIINLLTGAVTNK